MGVEQLIAAISLPEAQGRSGRLEGLAGLGAGVRVARTALRPLAALAGAGLAGAASAAGGFLGARAISIAELRDELATGRKYAQARTRRVIVCGDGY